MTRRLDLQRRAGDWAPKPYFAFPASEYRRLARLFRRYGADAVHSSDYDGYDPDTDTPCGFEALHAYIPPERWEACQRALQRVGFGDYSCEDEPEDVPRRPELGKRYWVSVPEGTERVEVIA